MNRALWLAGRLKPDIRLAQAVSEFEASLSSGDKARFRANRSQWHDKPPTIDDVMRLTAEADNQAIQQFVAVGDILVGGSQNLIACGVWSIVRITILAATLSASSMERLSLLFMTAGRVAPRFQGLALLYARSRLIRDYLSEYMIIVVQMCHYFYGFSRKSVIGQIASSLNESKIRNAEEELDRWGLLIKDEASFLLSQTIEHEAIENNKIRRWLGHSTKLNSHHQKIDKQLRWLEAFSTFDYETPWKQARKRGSSSSFVDILGYKQWKQKEGPRSLLLSGKMGCGKSVIMANMANDLSMSCPEDVVIYFFCRHDIPESLSARTVFGSFAAQIFQRHIGTEVMDDIFTDFVPSLMNLDRILEIIPTMIKRMKGVRLLLDGVDECPEEDFDLIRNGLLKISGSSDQADGLQEKIWTVGHGTIMSIPDDNPDIAEFIEAELKRLQKCGQLSVGDPSLLVTIKETLMRGADGMFLWVALQMETICAEKTDHLIRRALDNLPKSLSGTFRRILEKSKQQGHCYQRETFKILIGANRPLTVTEFREALSITPGDTSWNPRKMINDIYSTLACCGSLVVIDEEECTVRLLHGSVVQFLHDAGPDSMEWFFTTQDADNHLGQITITYLNYGVFDKRVSTRVIPRIHAGGAAGTIVTQVLRPFGAFGKKLSKAVVKSRKPVNRDIGKALFEIQSSSPENGGFDFLEYSSENLLSHASRMTYTSSSTRRLFRRLLYSPQFKPWSSDGEGPYQSDSASNISMQLQWAIAHSHTLVFSIGLHERLGLSTLLSVIRYLEYLLDSGQQLNVASFMCDKLLRITTLFRCNKATIWLIEMHHYTLDRYLELLRDSDWYGYSTFRWAVTRDCFRNLHDVVDPLLEEAISHKDIQTVKSLLRRGASLDTYRNEPPLQTAMRLSSSNPEFMLLVFRLLLTTQDLNALECSTFDIDVFLRCLFRSVNPRTILSYACERGDQSLLERISAGELETEMEMSIHNCNELLCKPLYGHPRKPVEIVSLLSMNWLLHNQSYGSALRQAMLLKDWRSAFEISRLLPGLLSFQTGNPLERCLKMRDGDNLEKYLNYGPRAYMMPGIPKDIGNSYPLFFLMASDWDGLEDCCKVAKFSTSVQKVCRPLPRQGQNDWLVKGNNDLLLSFFQRILQYLIDEGPEAHLLESSTDLQASVLFHLNTLLEDFSGPFTSKTDWFDLARMVLQRYRLMTSHLTTFRNHSSPQEIVMMDQIHILRSNFIRIAETLLRKRNTVLERQEDWSVMIQYCFEGWYPDALMETTLQAYGFQQTLANLAGAYRTLAVRNTMPLSWEALAAGPKVFQVFKDQGTILDQLHAADLCLSSQLDFSEEIRSARTVKAWRAGYSEWFSVGNRVEPFEHPFG